MVPSQSDTSATTTHLATEQKKEEERRLKEAAKLQALQVGAWLNPIARRQDVCLARGPLMLILCNLCATQEKEHRKILALQEKERQKEDKLRAKEERRRCGAVMCRRWLPRA